MKWIKGGRGGINRILILNLHFTTIFTVVIVTKSYLNYQFRFSMVGFPNQFRDFGMDAITPSFFDTQTRDKTIISIMIRKRWFQEGCCDTFSHLTSQRYSQRNHEGITVEIGDLTWRNLWMQIHIRKYVGILNITSKWYFNTFAQKFPTMNCTHDASYLILSVPRYNLPYIFFFYR